MLAQTQPSLLARAPRRCFHVTFEERRWVIGDGLTSLESPSGHLPSHPARGTCAARSKRRALGAANYPAADARSPGSCVPRGWCEGGTGGCRTDGKTKQLPLQQLAATGLPPGAMGSHRCPGAKSLSSPRDLAGGASLTAFLPRHALFTLNICISITGVFPQPSRPNEGSARYRAAQQRQPPSIQASWAAPPEILRSIFCAHTKQVSGRCHLQQVQPLIP